MLRVASTSDESYCLKTQEHSSFCNGTHHVCYRCGMLMGDCDCPSLGSMLDY